jgi:hypothetical protein
MVHVLESTLEWTEGEDIVNSGVGSHTQCFFFGLASVITLRLTTGAYCIVLAIYAPMIYTSQCVMFLICADTLQG